MYEPHSHHIGAAPWGQSKGALIANIIKRTPDLMHQSQGGMLRD
jgi:hypothetical protein